MDEDIKFLVTLLDNGTLLRCALKIKREILPRDCDKYPMKLENLKVLHEMLPLHVQTCGPIVEVEEIFEVHVEHGGIKQTDPSSEKKPDKSVPLLKPEFLTEGYDPNICGEMKQ